MKYVVGFVSIAFYLVACETGVKRTSIDMNVEYPTTFRDWTVDDYHGHRVADPYRWLEDDHAEETKAWVVAENQVTHQSLQRIPFRVEIASRLESLWNYERFEVPFKKGGKYFFFKNDGLQNQSVLYALDDLNGDPKVVLDPNEFSDDGTVALGGISLNENGRLLAYQVSEGGSDWHTIYIKDIQSGSLLPEKVEWVKFSQISWCGNGFYYSRFPAPGREEKRSAQNEFHKIYFHALGTGQDEDKLVMEDATMPRRIFFPMTTKDERFLCKSIVESSTGNALYVDDLLKGGERFVLEDQLDSNLTVIDNIGSKLYVLTDKEAPNWKLISIDLDTPDGREEVLLEEQKDVLGIHVL